MNGKVQASKIAAAGRGKARWAMMLVLFAGVLAVAGCSSMKSTWDDIVGNDPEVPPELQDPNATGVNQLLADGDQPVAEVYNEALDLLRAGKYAKAATQFEEVERQHPYSSWARRAILMTAYAHYEREAYSDAIIAAKRFLALHPGHEHAAYAYYLIGLSHYEQIIDVNRDQENTVQALEALEEVERRFPGTLYARDARAKAILAKDHLAGKEMKIGRYYLNQQAYVAAINRFKTVVTDYQTTSHTPEALMRLTEAYMALGIRSEAQTAAAVLGYNFPNSQWYQDAYTLIASDGLAPREDKESWISRAFNAVNPF
jgi:outer membrane protein assembly factor BamD